MANLTIIILTKNEEQNLEKCIASFKAVAKHIVIIDSYSTDKTVELAKSLGAEVYEHEFENHAAQFNWALDNINLQTEFLQAYWYRYLVDAKIYECEKKGTKMKPQADLKA